MALNVKKITQLVTDAAIMSKGFDDRQLMLLMTTLAYRFADDIEYLADDVSDPMFQDFYEDIYLPKLSYVTYCLSDEKFECISSHECEDFGAAYNEFSQKYDQDIFKYSMSTAVECLLGALILAKGTAIPHDKDAMFNIYKKFSLDLRKHIIGLDAEGESWKHFEPKLQKDIDAVMSVIRHISLKCPKQQRVGEPLDPEFVKKVIEMGVKGREEFHLEIPPCTITLEFREEQAN